MGTISIKPSQLAGVFHQEAKRLATARIQAAVAAGRRLVAHLKEQTDALGVTDRGTYKSAWKVKKHGDHQVVVFNDAPYAGIIEMGARPHGIPREVIEGQLTEWVKRKLLVASGPVQVTVHEGPLREGERRRTSRNAPKAHAPHDEAVGVAYAIANHIREHGVKGHFLAAAALPLAARWYREELLYKLTARVGFAKAVTP